MINVKKFLKAICLGLAIYSSTISPVSAEGRFLSLDISTSHYMSMPKPIKRVAVGDPDIANVVQIPASNNEFLIVAKKAGTTTIFVWTINGERFEYTIGVSQEDKGRAKLIEEAIGLPFVKVKMVEDRILLTGFVKDQYERNFAVQTAQLYVKEGVKTSISVGNNADISLQTQDSEQYSQRTIAETSKESAGRIIDLLQLMHPTQIKLEAQVIAISPEVRSSLGFQYSGALSSSATSATSAPGIFFGGEFYKDGNSSESYRNDYRNNISVALQALVTKNKAKILSRPSVTTMSGEMATIQVGGEIPYVVRDSNGVANTRFKDYGIIMQFRPSVDAQDRIVSAIHVEISKPNGETTDGQPILERRRTDSVITVSPGRTMVIGGLMDSSESKIVTKIPFLGDIPIIGEFFKYSSKSRDKQELAVLITPYLVDEDNLSVTRMSQDMKDYYKKEQSEEQKRENIDVSAAVIDENEQNDNKVVAEPFVEDKSNGDKTLNQSAGEQDKIVKSASEDSPNTLVKNEALNDKEEEEEEEDILQELSKSLKDESEETIEQTAEM